MSRHELLLALALEIPIIDNEPLVAVWSQGFGCSLQMNHGGH